MTIQFKKNKTRGIEWCDQTVNRTGGCFHECHWKMPDGSVGECYAETIAMRKARAAYGNGFQHHYWRPPKPSQKLAKLREPNLIFLDSMSDLFGQWVPKDHIIAILDELRSAPLQVGQVLTKNAPRIREFRDILPSNMWVGVSSPPNFMNGRRLTRRQQENMLNNQLDVVSDLRQHRADVVTWMSIEPLSWDIEPHLRDNCSLQWAVIGAATNGRKNFQPDPAHVSNVLGVLDANRVPVFFRGNLQWSPWREDFPPIDHPALHRRQRMAQKHGWTLNRFVQPSVAPDLGFVYTTLVEPEVRYVHTTELTM